jgi:hypothetical protein
MAITHAPAIVTNGLILHYDMGNTKKSFKGKPIVNQYEVPTPDGSGNVTFSIQGNGGSFVRVTSGTYGDYTVQPSDIVYSYTVGTNACHYHGMNLASPTISPGSYVTFSFDYYISPTCTGYPSTNFLANIEIYEPASPNWTYLTGASYGDDIPTVVGVWKTKTATVQVPANSTNPQVRCYMYPGACNPGRLADSGFILYRNPQAEVNGFRTPFVNGTRSNTQAILNLANSYDSQPNYMPYPYAGYNGSSFPLAAQKNDLGATYTYVTGVANPANAPGVLQYYTGTTGYQYFSIDSNAVPVTGRYTFSYYARLTGGSTSSSFGNSQIWRLTNDSDAYNSTTIISGDWNPTMTSNWKRFVVSGTITAGVGLRMFLVHSTQLTGGITVQYCGFQLERGSVATPFNPSTTSSKLTNTFTASSLTYASDTTFSFNGSSNYVTATSNTDFQFLGLQPFTLEAWVYPTANPGTNAWLGIICRESNPGSGRDGYNLYFNGSATTTTYFIFERFSAGSRSSAGDAVDSTLSVNNWSHLVATFDGYNMILYRNGTVLGTSGTTGSLTNTTAQLNIGMLGPTPASTLNFLGKIAVAKVYKLALSSAEVLQNFNALRGRYGL